MNKNRRLKSLNIKPTKEVKDRIFAMIYEQMYKDFDTMCAFNRIQYSINSISNDTISKLK
jgi:hypothetical protein